MDLQIIRTPGILKVSKTEPVFFSPSSESLPSTKARTKISAKICQQINLKTMLENLKDISAMDILFLKILVWSRSKKPSQIIFIYFDLSHD